MANETDRVFSDTELQEMRERSYEYGLPAYLQKDLDSYKAAMEAGDKIDFTGCPIFNSAGVLAKSTILGAYTTEKGKEKTVCACKDF